MKVRSIVAAAAAAVMGTAGALALPAAASAHPATQTYLRHSDGQAEDRGNQQWQGDRRHRQLRRKHRDTHGAQPQQGRDPDPDHHHLQQLDAPRGPTGRDRLAGVRQNVGVVAGA